MNGERYIIKDYETRGICPPKEISMKLASLFNLPTKYFYDDYFEFMDKDYWNVLKNWRIRNGLTIVAASKIAEVQYVTWSSWENKNSISRKNYLKLKALNI